MDIEKLKCLLKNLSEQELLDLELEAHKERLSRSSEESLPETFNWFGAGKRFANGLG